MKKLLVVTCLAALAVPLRAGAPGKSGFVFLRFSPYARAAAMAEATSAVVGDSLALYSNPAGLAHISSREISAQQAQQMDDVTYSHVSYAAAYRRGGFGVSAGMLTVGGITKTRVDSTSADRFVEDGEIDAGDRTAAVSWGRRHTDNLALGVTLKGVQETLDDQTAATVAADVGGIYRFNRRWRAAAVLQNAGTSGKFLSQKVPPPTRLRVGGHWTPEKYMQWAGELLFNLDAATELLLGGEFNWNQTGFARLGYRYSFRNADLGAAAGLSLGAGLNLGPFRADYAFLPFGDLGDSHRFSVAWKF